MGFIPTLYRLWYISPWARLGMPYLVRVPVSYGSVILLPICDLGPITTLSLLTSAIRYKYIPCEDCWENSNTTEGTPGGGDAYDFTPIELGSTIAFLVGCYLVRD